MRNNDRSPGLVVVSNRLPVVLHRDEDSVCRIEPASGGLVTALTPVLRNRGGTWVGWAGSGAEAPDPDALLRTAADTFGCRFRPVPLTEAEQQGFYQGFSNEIVWPLFHDLQTLCNFDPDYWNVYCAVNRKYADAIAAEADDDDLVWVHDYHLMAVAQELRQLRPSARIAFFLHIPFPPPDIYCKLPWRLPLLHALLQYDLIGFQTLRDQRNFAQCVRTLSDGVTLRSDSGSLVAAVAQRRVRIGHFPISIDYRNFAERSAAPDVAERAANLRALLPDRQLVLGVDRLDYTKGILLRLQAFAYALDRYPDLREHVTLIQVVVPSREDIPRYRELKASIEQLVGAINGRFTRPGGWVPIHYVFRSLEPADLLAYYRVAQIALVTPLKDGMNLVAKEYCACSIEQDCVLILSEFAGAAAQMRRSALLVNPYDIEGVADAIRRAYSMPVRERRIRMRSLRRGIREHDIFRWVDSFLSAISAPGPHDLPAPGLATAGIRRTNSGV
ncbi:MAG: trehalose-6-phosphate synthase [Gammaproteobacteria bacterium]|nr:trehalose-6-phosphate synthase [Gammaproteobacteria bacterium]